MCNKIVNVSIIGAGNMAEEYLKVLTDLDEYKVVGMFSRNITKCNNLKKKYKFSEVFESIECMHAHSESDLLIVACSAESTKTVADHVTKYSWTILFEKPIGLNFLEYEEISRVCSERNSKAYVALNRRYYSSTRKLKEMIDLSNSPRYINIFDQENIDILKEFNRNEKLIKNWMYANSIHLIDFIDILSRGNLIELKVLDKWNKKNPTIVSARLKFDSGDIINYSAIWNRPAPWGIKISTKEKYFELSPIEKLIYIDKFSREIKNIGVDNVDIKYKPGLYNLLKEMYECLNNRPHNIVSVSENKNTMTYIKDIYAP